MYKLPSRLKKKYRREAKPELVPVMDAMFIMIFFILSTAEFIKLSEIGSDLPIMKLSTDPNPEEKKLILKMKLGVNSVELVNDVNQQQFFSGNLNSADVFLNINSKVKEIKAAHPAENRIMVSSENNVRYELLVKALDAVRQTEIAGVKEKLFNQIIFR